MKEIVIYQTHGILTGVVLAALYGVVIAFGIAPYMVPLLPPVVNVMGSVLFGAILWYSAASEKFAVKSFNEREVFRAIIAKQDKFMEDNGLDMYDKNSPKNSEKVGELKGDTDV